MTPEQKAAYIIAMTGTAMAEMLGMAAENQHRMNNGEAIAYREDAFQKVVEKHGIHHNAVCTFFQN